MTKMESGKAVAETPNPESLTTAESSEVASELIIEKLSNNMAVEEAKTIGAIDQMMSKNFIEPKQSNFDQSSIIITKDVIEINELLKHDNISYNTNVITATDRGDIELTPNNDIDTSMKPNGIQNNNLNKENVYNSNQENCLLIENEHENNSASFNSQMSNSEQDIIEKKALEELINEIESDEMLSNEKSASFSNESENSSEITESSLNITEKLSKLTEKASKPKNMEGNDDLLTNNNNDDYDNSLNAKNSCNKHDEQQKSKSEDSALNTECSAEITEGSAETLKEPAVDIKCEVDCDALLDDIKDEIIYDEDYNVPENFMELANHFLTTEAIVVLQRIVVYKCPECPRVFASSGQRALHKAKHVSEQVQSQKRNLESSDERFIKRHQCPECDMRFVQESTLETHMDIHQPYPNICDCGIGYTKLTDLEQHEKLVHNRIKTKSTYTSTWKPIINLKKTKRSEINRKRLKRQPEVPEPSPEPTISRYGRTQKRLVNIREKSPILEYSSDDLDDDTAFQPKKKKAKVKFQSPENIKAEEERLIKKENNKVKNKEKRKEKRKAIKQENIGQFICGICNKELSSFYTYEQHLLVHSNLRNYKCEICDKRYNTAAVLKNHQQTHLENPYQCSFCDKTFNAKANLKTHENIHMGLKLHVCGYCEKSFSDRSAFKRHERTHTGVKPYKCEYCPKAFSDASAAIIHRRRHKGERNIACRVCGQAFFDAGARNNHELLHSSNYKFECDLCSAKFQLKQYLVMHLRVHVPRKMIKCKLCRKELYNVNLDRHKRDVHGIGVKKTKKFKKPERFDIKAPLEIEIDTTKEF